MITYKNKELKILTLEEVNDLNQLEIDKLITASKLYPSIIIAYIENAKNFKPIFKSIDYKYFSKLSEEEQRQKLIDFYKQNFIEHNSGLPNAIPTDEIQDVAERVAIFINNARKTPFFRAGM